MSEPYGQDIRGIHLSSGLKPVIHRQYSGRSEQSRISIEIPAKLQGIVLSNSLRAHVDKYLDMLIFFIDEPAMVSICAPTFQPSRNCSKLRNDEVPRGTYGV